jgi:hypothetical protein
MAHRYLQQTPADDLMYVWHGQCAPPLPDETMSALAAANVTHDVLEATKKVAFMKKQKYWFI